MPISRWRRPAALLLSLLIPFSGVFQSYVALACGAHHETVVLQSHHHHDHDHIGQAQVPHHDHAGNQDSCNCQSLCQPPVVIVAPAGQAHRVTQPQDRQFEPAERRDVLALSDRDRHFLPFSTAPPTV